MNSVNTRLSTMMFLQYAVWGVWLPILARYLQAPVDAGGLGFTAYQVGWILGLAGSIGAVSSPFIAGQLADRYFSTEKFMACLLLFGGIAKFITAYQTSYSAWLILSIVYSVLYMPTLALTNSIAFANMKDADSDFGKIRVWGTFGWIAASWLFPMIWLQTDLKFQALPPFFVGTEVADSTHRLADALKASGVVSILYAGFCLLLPHTPPKKNSVEKLAFAKAFALLKHPSFMWLVIASLPIAIIHQIYFMQTGPFMSDVLFLRDSDIGPAMTIGQFMEIAVMAGLGLMLKRFGFRWTLTVGCSAYVLRYLIFGAADMLPVPVVVASQALHGFCYACFFAAAYIYVERLADPDVRNSAQTVFGIIILGIGPVIAAPVQGSLVNMFTDQEIVLVKPAEGEPFRAKLIEDTDTTLTVEKESGETVTLNKEEEIAEHKAFLDYSKLWYTLAAMGLITTVGVAALFRDETLGRAGPTGPEALTEEIMEA